MDDATWLRDAPAAPEVTRDAEAKRIAFNYVLREEPDSTIARVSWSSLLDAAVAYYTLHGHLPMNLTGNSMTGVSLFSQKAYAQLAENPDFYDVLSAPAQNVTRAILEYALFQVQHGPDSDAWAALDSSPSYTPPTISNPAYRRPPIHAAIAAVTAGWRHAVRMLNPDVLAARPYDVLYTFCHKFTAVDGLTELMLRAFKIRAAASAEDSDLLTPGLTWRSLTEFVGLLGTSDMEPTYPGTQTPVLSNRAELERIRFGFYRLSAAPPLW